MKESEGIAHQLGKHRIDQVARAHQLGRGVANNTFRLKAVLRHPDIREFEQPTTVVVLEVVDSRRPIVLEHGDVLGYSVRNARQ